MQKYVKLWFTLIIIFEILQVGMLGESLLRDFHFLKNEPTSQCF